MINVFVYDKEVKRGSLSSSLLHSKRFWVDIKDPSKDELKKITEVFGFTNKITNYYSDQTIKSKVGNFKDYIVSKLYTINTEKNIIVTKEVVFVLGRNYLITLRNGDFKHITQLVREPDKLNMVMRVGVDYLFYTIVDLITDDYFTELEIIDKELDVLESETVKSTNTDVLKRLFKIKSQFIDLKKVVYPQREVLSQLSKLETRFIHEDIRRDFVEVYDHMILVTEIIESCRETITSIRELHASIMSNKLNETMKILTIIATMFMPITFIASAYGMNFKFLPLSSHPYGFLIINGFMSLLFVIMWIYFLRKKWI